MAGGGYKGTYDGQGHSITITSVNNGGGLFNWIDHATIRNLTMKGTIPGGSTKGGIANYDRGGYSTIINCCNECGISGSSTLGGIIGEAKNTTITNCINKGNITAEDTYSGGIAGKGTGTINCCVNIGNISNIGNSSAYLGGIAGRANLVSNCYNTGEIYAKDGWAGGITFSSNTENCYNIGMMSGGSNMHAIRGYGAPTNSYYLNGIKNTGSYGVAVTEEELKGLASTLGEEWTDDTIGINNGYPILKWQLESN